MTETDYKEAIAALRRVVSGLKRERAALEAEQERRTAIFKSVLQQRDEWERRARELGWTESGRPPETL